MSKKGEKCPAESRDRVFIGEANIAKLIKMADKIGDKTGIRPSIHQVIGMLIDKAKA